MKIQIVSDLHLEFDRDKFQSFINDLDPTGVDVLVLAGDICTARNMVGIIGAICRRYSEAKVVWVHGNHEFYGSDRETVHRLSKQAVDENPNLRWLDNSWTEIDGQRFIGTPLWFRYEPSNEPLEELMNDFHVIRGFKGWVYKENKRATDFLRNEMKEGDIVVTHHLPAERSVHPIYKGDGLNCFFLCDMEETILERWPAVWIHGHTHHSFNYEIDHEGGKCRVVCNPRGYNPMALNVGFVVDKIISV